MVWQTLAFLGGNATQSPGQLSPNQTRRRFPISSERARIDFLRQLVVVLLTNGDHESGGNFAPVGPAVDAIVFASSSERRALFLPPPRFISA